MLFHVRMDVSIPDDLDPDVRADTVARAMPVIPPNTRKKRKPTKYANGVLNEIEPL